MNPIMQRNFERTDSGTAAKPGSRTRGTASGGESSGRSSEAPKTKEAEGSKEGAEAAGGKSEEEETSEAEGPERAEGSEAKGQKSYNELQ